MNISPKIADYIKNSMINGRVCRFAKRDILYYISPISASISQSKKYDYYNIINKAAFTWNQLDLFDLRNVSVPQDADIVINWVKTGRIYEGMCKYRSIIASEIKAVTIEIGLPNSYSPKIINDDTILHSALHEFGHAIGLGHGVEEDDVMYVPHKKTLKSLSKNDMFVAELLYYNSTGTLLSELYYS